MPTRQRQLRQPDSDPYNVNLWRSALDYLGLVVLVLEPDPPVGAVAERFVLRVPAAAKRVVLSRGALVQRLALELDTAANVVTGISAT